MAEPKDPKDVVHPDDADALPVLTDVIALGRPPAPRPAGPKDPKDVVHPDDADALPVLTDVVALGWPPTPQPAGHGAVAAAARESGADETAAACAPATSCAAEQGPPLTDAAQSAAPGDLAQRTEPIETAKTAKTAETAETVSVVAHTEQAELGQPEAASKPLAPGELAAAVATVEGAYEGVAPPAQPSPLEQAAVEPACVVPPVPQAVPESHPFTLAELSERDAEQLAERLRVRFAGYLREEGRGVIEARCREALEEHTTWLVRQVTREVTREVALALESEVVGWVRDAVREELAAHRLPRR